MVVSTPSGRMPRSSQTPLTPVPVPISTTARALPAAASSRSAAPAPGVTASRPDLAGQAAGGAQDEVLGDVRLGELLSLCRRTAGTGDRGDGAPPGAVRGAGAGWHCERRGDRRGAQPRLAPEAITGATADCAACIRAILEAVSRQPRPDRPVAGRRGAGSGDGLGGTDVTDGWNWRQPGATAGSGRRPPAAGPAAPGAGPDAWRRRRRPRRRGGPTRWPTRGGTRRARPPWCRRPRRRPTQPEPVTDPDAPGRPTLRHAPARSPWSPRCWPALSAARSATSSRSAAAPVRRVARRRARRRRRRWPSAAGVAGRGRRAGPAQRGHRPGAPGGTSAGSGFVVTADGYVITNDHVVAGGTGNAVGGLQRRQHRRRRRWSGSDPESDIAVIKVAPYRAARRSSSATPTRSRSATRCSPSARRWRWPTRSPPASSAPWTGRSQAGEPGGADALLRGDPDRRRGQPGQLRRPAGRRRRPGHRDQLGDQVAGRRAGRRPATSASPSPSRSTRPSGSPRTSSTPARPGVR